jgi:hypothetical protein
MRMTAFDVGDIFGYNRCDVENKERFLFEGCFEYAE